MGLDKQKRRGSEAPCLAVSSLHLSQVLGWENVCSRGHVILPLKSEVLILFFFFFFPSDILPFASRLSRGGRAAAAHRTVGTAFASEPISHQMSPSAASASNSPADNVPCMLNIWMPTHSITWTARWLTTTSPAPDPKAMLTVTPTAGRHRRPRLGLRRGGEAFLSPSFLFLFFFLPPFFVLKKHLSSEDIIDFIHQRKYQLLYRFLHLLNLFCFLLCVIP